MATLATWVDGTLHEGWHLEQRHKPTLALLSVSSVHDRVADDKELAMSVKDAREALWMALREGFFAASGIDTQSGRRVEISALEWHELVPVEAKNETDEVRRGLLGDGYRDVLFPIRPPQGYWCRPEERLRPTLPPLMEPTGFGYMPLFCAAQWIATEGGTQEIDPTDVGVWRAPFAHLLAAIASGAVKIVGVNGHQTLPVPPHLFVGIQVDHPYAEPTIEMILSNELVLRSYPYVDDEHWRKGFDDALVDRGGNRWLRLSVEKADVGRFWPFAESLETSTGLPGRPAKAKHLISDEMQRRANESRLCASLAQEAEALLDWLAVAHPTLPRPTQRTISNNIRADYRRLKGTK